ncbi:DUF5071 domain-containing protein [Paenibacillus luteus]|uniref:DUF5071 domain-containing protein n=1 Tax=Paenibacillus luteus TaxID=2545753 RepID=UPI001144F4CF|nr:DUF5071 domain-containing protein [Paenibacillus luteus]
MKDIKDLIPQHKHDMDTIDKLKNINHDETDLGPIMDDLFEWIQDINWPIAQELCKIIPQLKLIDVVPQIQKVLNSNDDCWQFACIHFLIPKLSLDMRELIKADLLRIIQNPTRNEKLCEIDQGAREVYESLF